MARVAFVAKIAVVEPLGLMRLSAALLRAGHDTLLVDPTDPASAGDLEAFAPQLLCFSVITGQHLYYRRIAGVLREHLGAPVLFGGPHATFFPQEVEQDEVDAVCVGEGEDVIVEIADALDGGAGRIPNLPGLQVTQADGTVWRGPLRPLIDDVDGLPWPDRPLLRRASRLHRVAGRHHFIASRGCAYKCTYCYNHAAMDKFEGLGRFVRFRSPQDLVGECEAVARDYRFTYAYFLDDIFIMSRSWFAEFAELYAARVGVPYCAHVRAEMVTEEAAELLAMSGCRAVNLGIEAGSERVRRQLLDRPMTDEEIVGACERLHAVGVKVVAPNIIGIPGTTLEEELATIQLNQRARPDHPSVSIFQPYPGTRLAELAQGMGEFDGGFDGVPESFYDDSVVDVPHRDQLRTLYLLFHLIVVLRIPEPVVRRLVRLPPGRLIEALSVVGKGVTYTRIFHQRRTVEEWRELVRNVFTSGIFGHWGQVRMTAGEESALVARLAALH